MIGILAIQGNYEAHARILSQLNMRYSFIVSPDQLKKCDGLIIPGGESSTMLKFILANGLFDEIKNFNAQHKPILGTCAGAILLAKEVISPAQTSLGLIDITIERNGYGRQFESHILTGEELLNHRPQEMLFIRAPKILKTDGVKIVATCQNEVVGVEQNHCIALTFHPELLNITFWHEYFFSD